MYVERLVNSGLKEEMRDESRPDQIYPGRDGTVGQWI